MDGTIKKIFLNEATQRQKEQFGMYLFMYVWTLAIKSMIAKLQTVEPQRSVIK